jgi:hypothetical protein
MLWQSENNVWRRTWYVQKQFDRIFVTTTPQLSGERHEMIIVNPYYVVVIIDRRNCIRKNLVNSPVTTKIGVSVFCQVDAAWILERGATGL